MKGEVNFMEKRVIVPKKESLMFYDYKQAYEKLDNLKMDCKRWLEDVSISIGDTLPKDIELKMVECKKLYEKVVALFRKIKEWLSKHIDMNYVLDVEDFYNLIRDLDRPSDSNCYELVIYDQYNFFVLNHN